MTCRSSYCAHSLLALFTSAAVLDAQASLGVIEGAAPGDNVIQVAPITDINGDGIQDLAIFSAAGIGPAVGVLLHSGVPPHPRLGEILGPQFTFRVSDESFAVIGDYDGDGHSDVAYREGSSAGHYVQLYNARTLQFLARFDDPGVNQWGFIVGGVGDIDGNGHDDLLVGGEDSTFHVYGGPNGNLIRTHVGIGAYGNSFALLGDLDGDGVRDFAIGSGGASRVWVLSGATGAELMQLSRHPVDGFGHALADAGDMNGDGVPDVIVGAPCSPAFTCPRNYVYVLSGVDGSEIWRIEGDRPERDDRFGMDVHGAGDINGDGVPDFAVGTRVNQGNYPMYADFYSGRTATLLWRFRESNPFSDFVGFPRILPDLDGDGLGEFAYAEPRAAFTATLAGRIWLFRGRHGDADRYCPSTPNSSGAVGRLLWQGPISVGHTEAGVRVETGLAGSFAQVVYGVPQSGVPFGNGSLCIGGTTLYRWGPPLLLDGTGAAQRAVDWTAGPHVTGPGAWLPGAAFGLQAVYRDAVGARFDTTGALRIVFAP